MDPASVSLSAVSLFIQCLEAYRIFSTARCVDSDVSLLKTKFAVEETRITQWGIQCGFSSDPQENTLNETLENAGKNVNETVKRTLDHISTLLKKYDVVAAKYGSENHGRMSIRWAIRDKAKLEEILKHLKDFNNSLYQLLPRKVELSLEDAFACALTRKSDGGELDNIITALVGMQLVDAAKLAELKRTLQTSTSNEEQNLHPQASQLYLDEGRISFSTRYTSEERTFSSLEGNGHIIVEWKDYHQEMLSGSATARITVKYRASHLAELMSARSQLPKGLRILTCIGYFDQAPQQRFGFAYEFPPKTVRHMPFKLHELLLRPGTIPALGTRFAMAHSLARTVNLLHSSGWLHKSIRPGNILIFQAQDNNNTPQFETPYLAGFNFSRPDGYGEETLHERSATLSTNQLYRHPEVQGPHPRRSVAADDAYSLGLVLLEIALWRPLATIEGRRPGDTENPLDMDKIKDVISTSLPKTMGMIYKNALERCLNMHTTESQEESSLATVKLTSAEWNAERQKRQNAFYWDVVSKLEECRA